MGPKLVMFAGAPEASNLKWDEIGLLNDFIEPIARFAGIEREIIPITQEETRATLQPLAWRSLPLEKRALETGFTQSFDERQFTKAPVAQGWLEDSRGASFFTTSQIDSVAEDISQQQATESFGSAKSVEEVLSQFYEESYARHEAIPSSQISPDSVLGTSFASSQAFTESFDSLAYSSSGLGDVPIAGHLGNLKDIPNAKYLNSIQPQTMTVNLIIGIISIPEPRLVRTRRGANVELIEVLVGDETKSGFGINFWLSPQSDLLNENSMRSVLKNLRPQDIILVKNVALSSFRDKVYGQSLRKDMTKVHLLYRNRIDKTDIRGCYSAADFALDEKGTPQIEKTRRVRDWVAKFVRLGAADVASKEKRTGWMEEAAQEILPEDTQ